MTNMWVTFEKKKVQKLLICHLIQDSGTDGCDEKVFHAFV